MIQANQQTVVALGSFDGVHLGHTRVIRTAGELAASLGCRLTVWTFRELPFGKNTTLTSNEEREEIFASLGVDRMILAEFDAIRSLSPEEFVRDILVGQLQARVAVCGFNYRFGAGGKGDPSLLKTLMNRYGGDARMVEPVEMGGEPVSSTRIRALVAEGNMEEAALLLGRSYFLSGRVGHGRAIGHSLGFPTVNLPFPENRTIPRLGVYASVVRTPVGIFRGVTNVGIRPTVNDGMIRPVCETFLLDFSGDLYDCTLQVAFGRFLRPEKKFPSFDALKAAIAADIAAVRAENPPEDKK